MAESLIPFLLPLIVVLGLTVPPLFVLLRTSTQYKTEMAAAPAPVDGITAAGLTPTEVGYLCGGPQYAAETALADLYLRGRIRREDEDGSLFVLTDPDDGNHASDPLRDDIVHALRAEGPQRLDGLIDTAQDGPGMVSLREGLADKGLLVDTATLRRTLATRNGIHSLIIIGVFGGTGLLVAAVLLGLNSTDTTSWHLGSGLAGVVSMVLGAVGFAVSAATGGRLPTKLTPTGETLAQEATASHGDTSHWSATERVGLDQALRRTAVTGIPQLSRVVSRGAGPKHKPQGEAAPTVVVAAGEPGIETMEGEGREFDFGFLYQFVEEFWATDEVGGYSDGGGDGGDGGGDGGGGSGDGGGGGGDGGGGG